MSGIGQINTMSSHKTYIAEIPVESATGEVARIYAEIRRLTGGPLVALFYRHLAALPGALEAVWQSVSPLLETGELQEGAWSLSRGAWTGPVPDGALQGMDRTALAHAGGVVDAYNRANPVNFALMLVVRATGRAQPAASAASVARGAWTPPTPLPGIASIPRMDTLDARTRLLVDAFGKSGAPGEPVLVPTLYRHIAHWPALLDRVSRLVLPRLADGTFVPAIHAFRDGIARLADDLVARCAPARHPLLDTPDVNEVFERFAPVIPEMVVVGHFLRTVLDRAPGLK